MLLGTNANWYRPNSFTQYRVKQTRRKRRELVPPPVSMANEFYTNIALQVRVSPNSSDVVIFLASNSLGTEFNRIDVSQTDYELLVTLTLYWLGGPLPGCFHSCPEIIRTLGIMYCRQFFLSLNLGAAPNNSIPWKFPCIWDSTWVTFSLSSPSSLWNLPVITRLKSPTCLVACSSGASIAAFASASSLGAAHWFSFFLSLCCVEGYLELGASQNTVKMPLLPSPAATFMAPALQ